MTELNGVAVATTETPLLRGVDIKTLDTGDKIDLSGKVRKKGRKKEGEGIIINTNTFDVLA